MKSEIVCNTSPLITSARVGRLHLLQLAFQRLIIPQAVHEELMREGSNRSGAEDVERADWIEVRPVRDHHCMEALRQFLRRGESEAIVFAQEVSAALVLLDDRKARTLAQREGLIVVGTLGVLKNLKERKKLDVLRHVFDDLRRAGFYMGTEYDEILRQVDE